MRKVQFENDKYYHIYNRGVDKREIFLNDKDFIRFIISMREFNVVEPIGSLKMELGRKIQTLRVCGRPLASESKTLLVDIVCYCLIRNHIHLILRQRQKSGVSHFMLKLAMGYTKYFNIKYERSGSLFQGTFKAKHIDSAKYLAWVSAYVNGNVEIHKFVMAEDYQWSSYWDYLGLRNGTLCDKMIVMNEFNNNKEYKEFVDIVIKDSKERKEYLTELE